jgi:phage FluMu protein Com
MLVVRCRQCNKELSGGSGQSKSCGCPNMTTIKGDSVTAVDLTKVIMVNSNSKEKSEGLTSQDLQWQEERRKRKVRRLDFEVR